MATDPRLILAIWTHYDLSAEMQLDILCYTWYRSFVIRVEYPSKFKKFSHFRKIKENKSW